MALRASDGPVLECGMGDNSTPFLAKFCKEHRRRLVSFEHNPDWIEKYADAVPGLDHDLIIIPSVDGMPGCPDWNLAPWNLHTRWSVALIDQRPSSGRLVAISALQYTAKFLVVHDTEQPLYFYDPLFQTFKYRSDDRSQRAWTTVLSNYEYLDVGNK